MINNPDDVVAATERAAELSPDPARLGERVFTWTRGSQVTHEPIDWWEPGLIPRGYMTVLAGRGDVGKSTAAVAWAAEETRRGGVVAWLHSEESRSLIMPKLRAANAIEDAVMFLDVGVQMDDRVSETRLELPRDSERLAVELKAIGCRFIVFDALTSFKGGGKSANSVDDVREFLEPIQTMAGNLGAVVLGIAHLGKSGERNARDSVLGSSAWTDVPRSVLAFARDDENDAGVISAVKANLAPTKRSIRYEFETVGDPTSGQVGRVIFTGDTELSVDDLRVRDSQGSEGTDDVDRWLDGYMDQDRKATEVFSAADANGHTRDQVKRAKRRLNIAAVKRGSSWWWQGRTQGSEESAAAPYVSDSAPLLPSRSGGVNTCSLTAREQGSNCAECGEPMTFPDDVVAGTHEGCQR